MKNFISIFKDDNDWIVIQEFIYNSVVWIVLGSFGIDGVQKFANKKDGSEG
jgi:hypothetical protein